VTSAVQGTHGSRQHRKCRTGPGHPRQCDPCQHTPEPGGAPLSPGRTARHDVGMDERRSGGRNRAPWFLARRELATRWKAVVVLGLLAGIAGVLRAE